MLLDYDENQPRAPAGTPEGGQWVPAEASSHPVFGANARQNIREAIRYIESQGFKAGEWSPKNKNPIIAAFSGDIISINKNHSFWKNPNEAMRRYFERGALSSPNAAHILHHEIGHAIYDPQDNFLTMGHQEHAKKNVSSRASVNPKEFVSEVYAGLRSGRSFDQETIRLFRQYARHRKTDAMEMSFIDAADVSGARITADGYLVADARIARTGVQVYSGAEVGRPELASVRIYRPDDEVFSADAMASLAHRPVTNDHPPESVKAANWKRFAVGMTGDTVTKDGGFVRVPLTLMDQAAIDALKGGKRELSVGYVCALDWTAGTAPDGQAYDAIQRGIRANHLALVDKARAGHDCRIGDRDSLPAKQGKATMTDRKITVDGFTFDASEQAAQAITKLETKVADASKALNDANEAHAKALAAKDADIAKKDAEIDALKKAAISDAEIDKRVAARADLVSTAKAIAADVKTEGLSDAAIRKATVIAKLGDAAVKDKSDAYIDARFDILAEDAKTAKKPDPLAAAAKAAMGDKAAGGGDPQAMRDGAYNEYVANLNGKKEAA